LDGSDTEGVSPISGRPVRERKHRKAAHAARRESPASALVASSFWIFGGDEKATGTNDDGTAKVEVSTKDMVNRISTSRSGWRSPKTRCNRSKDQLKSVNGQQQRLDQLSQQVELLKGKIRRCGRTARASSRLSARE
jgi:conjugal transfer pilus assembly protein TraB